MHRYRAAWCSGAVLAALAVLWGNGAAAQSIVVDNSDPQFHILYGTWNTGAFGTPWGADYNWSLTTGAGGQPAAAEWRPNLPAAGTWRVETYYVAGTNRASDAPFTVIHANGSTPVTINQQTNGQTWVTLGIFNFDAGTGGAVRLENNAGPSVVIADAVRFTPVAASEQFRGFWADAFHVGFKSAAQIDDMVARAVQGNYNAILAEVMAFQDTGAGGHGAYWNSAIVPRASDISGPPTFDPLAYLIQQAHAAGIEVHAWLVTYRVSASWPPAGNSTLAAHPEWFMVPSADIGGGPAKVNNYYVLDPGSPDVQAYLLSIVAELVSNYALDGIHWDYIRYTTTDAGYPADLSYANSGLARFQRIYNYAGVPSPSDPAWSDFRRREITELIRRAQVLVATADNPRQPLRHTAALITWGDAPSNFTQTNSWRLFQNWRLWLEQGYLDAGIPMTYYDQDTYPTWFENWVNQALVWRYQRHIFTGPGIYLNDFADSLYQINYAIAAGADGVSTYSYATTRDGMTDWSWYSLVSSQAFTDPAVPPAMPWRDPAAATEGAVYGRVVDGATGEPIDDATVRINGFDVTYTDGNGFFVITRLAADPNGTLVPVSVVAGGYSEVARPFVLVTPAGWTEANFGLGAWLAGDADVDGDVDFADFQRLAGAMTGPDLGPPPPGGDVFDFDQDIDVDLHDIATFQAAFTGP